VLLWGGYGRHWAWTGINGRSATLWDWLHLLLLPAAFGVVPVWLSKRTRVGRRHKSVGFAAIAVFIVLVMAGYMVPWAWTGFSGNRLWQWLELLLLPLAIALTPIYTELRAAWKRRHTMLTLTGMALFAIVALGGYLIPWTWTGFRGNTAWDWLHLLLLPLLLPTLVVPAVIMPLATAGVVYMEDPAAPPTDTNDARTIEVSGRAGASPAGHVREPTSPQEPTPPPA
jgi:hypothetical protein